MIRDMEGQSPASSGNMYGKCSATGPDSDWGTYLHSEDYISLQPLFVACYVIPQRETSPQTPTASVAPKPAAERLQEVSDVGDVHSHLPSRASGLKYQS